MTESDVPEWRKSSRSGDSDCVEVAIDRRKVAVRDSKHADGPALVFSPADWAAFLTLLVRG